MDRNHNWGEIGRTVDGETGAGFRVVPKRVAGGTAAAEAGGAESARTAGSSLDPVNAREWGGLRKQAHRMLDDMMDHLEGIGDKPLWQEIPKEFRERFHGAMPKGPTELSAVHEEFMRAIVPYTAANAHPGFMGWVQGGGTPVGMLAEMLAAGLNANVGGRDQIPLEVESEVVEWMRALFGFPEGSSGIFLSGTSMATFVAVVVARDAFMGREAANIHAVRRLGVGGEGLGIKGLTAYASKATHGSVARALDMAGIGSEALRLVPVDRRQRIDLKALAKRIVADRTDGMTPFLVVGNAGTVDTGAIDDLEGLAEICVREQIWFHVDGAYGALAMLVPELQSRLKGIERADSLAFDFHKWAQVPYDAGFLLMRDGEAHREAFVTSCGYLAREERGMAAGATWPCDLGPELSRGFRALKVWMTLKVYGTEAIGRVIQTTCELARYLESRIRSSNELELLATVELNVVCFRYQFEVVLRGISEESKDNSEESNTCNREIVMRLQEAGAVAPSVTTVDGKIAIRAAFVNHRTTRSEVDTLVEQVLVEGRRLKPSATVAKVVDGKWKPRLDRESKMAELNEQLAASETLTLDEESELRVDRAMMLDQLGRSLEARNEYLKVLEINPEHRRNLIELGQLLLSTGHKRAAKIVFAESVKHHPQDLASRVNLGSVLLDEGDAAAAKEQYEIALAIDAEFPQAHGGMYYALGKLGEYERAAWHRAKGFGRRNLFRSPYRGKGPPVPIVLLVSSTGGNTPIEKLLNDEIFQTYVVVADFYDVRVPLPEHRLLVNGIGDVEIAAEALNKAQELLKISSEPLLNAPSAVLVSGRCENASRMARLPGVVTATTANFPYEVLAGEGGIAALEERGFNFPVLLRVPGFHMGEHFVRVDSKERLQSEVALLPGGDRPETELLAIQYLDARGRDGFARKYRVMFVDGGMYPLHLAISPNWKIHYFSADMAERPDHREEEKRFLTDMASVLGEKAMRGLWEIQETLALDYGGIDFGLSLDGEILLFETNATMVAEPPPADERWNYRRAGVARIHAAVQRMLLEKSGARMVAKVAS
jgi:glutamate/tyrosine decarboxylase-like PLP-dependent enzyme